MIKNVTIAGGGTLGSQIAWQTAFSGFNVTVYDAFDKGIEACKQSHQKYAGIYKKNLGATALDIQKTNERVTYTTDLGVAIKDADLLSESVPEDPKIKMDFYQQVSQLAPGKTIFTTNSSTLLPRDFVEAVDRPEKFLALHFANLIWLNNIGEVMAHKGTDPKYIEIVRQFARDIGMVPVVLKKERNGYILNSILGPMLTSAMELVQRGVADYEDVDRTMMVSGFESGPFKILDVIGLETAYNVEIYWGNRLQDKQRLANAAYIKENYIDKGKLGLKTGEGFYKYPNPKFKDPDFLK